MTHVRCGFNPFSQSRNFGDIGRSIQAGADVAIGAATNATNAAINKRTNKTNKEIAEATNALNYKIHQEDMNFNAEQAQLQRDWDSPEAQRERLIEAGYNPLMLDSGDFSSGAAATAPSAPSMEMATMNPLTLDARSMQALPALAMAAGIDLTDAQAGKERAIKDGIDLKNKFDGDTFNTRVEMEENRARFLYEQMSDFINSTDFRTASRRQQQTAWKYFNDMADRTKRDSDQIFEQRKKEFSWWQEVTDNERKKFDLVLKQIKAQTRNIEQNTAYLNALQQKAEAEKKTIDELRPEQKEEIKGRIILNRVASAMEILHVPQNQRKQLAAALVSAEDGDTKGFYSALNDVSYSGDVNNWFSAAQKFFGVTSIKDFFSGAMFSGMTPPAELYLKASSWSQPVGSMEYDEETNTNIYYKEDSFFE